MPTGPVCAPPQRLSLLRELPGGDNRAGVSLGSQPRGATRAPRAAQRRHHGRCDDHAARGLGALLLSGPARGCHALHLPKTHQQMAYLRRRVVGRPPQRQWPVARRMSMRSVTRAAARQRYEGEVHDLAVPHGAGPELPCGRSRPASSGWGVGSGSLDRLDQRVLALDALVRVRRDSGPAVAADPEVQKAACPSSRCAPWWPGLSVHLRRDCRSQGGRPTTFDSTQNLQMQHSTIALPRAPDRQAAAFAQT